MLRLNILGAAEFTGPDGKQLKVVVDQPKLLALTAYLAVARRGAAVRRDALLPLFWPEQGQSAARHALSQALSVLRSELGPRVLDGKYRETVQLDRDHLWCDVTTFQRTLEEGQPEEALALYGGPLLEGLYLRQVPEFERWLEEERRQLQRMAYGAALGLAADARAEGRWSDGCRWADCAIALDAYDERGWRDLLVCLDGSGNRAKVVLAYERMVRLFRKDLGVQPTRETAELVEALRLGRFAEGLTATAADTSVEEPPQGQTVRPGERRAEDRQKARPGSRRTLVVAVTAAIALVAVGLSGLEDAFEGTRPGTVRSVVVLPLADVDPVDGDEYFADALTAELGNALGAVDGLAVISHGSALLYRDRTQSVPDIARELSVDAAIEGQVQRQDTMVRITLQLVDGRTDRRLWSAEFQGGLGSILDLRQRVAHEVAATIGASYGDRAGQVAQQRPVDPRAYDAYLRGLHHLERYNTEEAAVAVGYLRRAVQIEPGFAPAHAALARACTWAWTETPRSAETEACSAAAREAIHLDESLADGHAALGFVLHRKLMFGLDPEWDWPAAEHEFREAIRLNPNAADAYEDYAELLRIMRRHDEARAALEEARRLNPLSPGITLRVGIQALAERRFDDALALWSEILNADPTYTTAHYAAGATFIAMRQPQPVLREADEVAKRLGDEHIWVLDLRAHGHALAGDLEEALGFARRPDGSPDRLTLASLYAVIGDTALALDELERTLKENPAEIPNLTASVRFDELRDHPRFVAVREAVGL